MKFSPKKSVHALSLTALVLMAVLAGCSSEADGNPELEDTTDASSPEPTEYVPASAEGPAQNVPEPEFPTATKENSIEGAQSTLKYFWKAVDYGRLTGDTTHAERVASDDCDLCTDLVTGWRQVYEEESWAALYGEMQLWVNEVNLSRLDAASPDRAEISFSMTEPPVDFYEDGKLLEEESFDSESSADWWAQLVFDGTAQSWQIEWVGLESQVLEDEN